MDTKETKNKIKDSLAEFLGVETADINDDDDFVADLQMEPTMISDFQEKLKSEGIDLSNVDFNEANSITELTDLVTDGVVANIDTESTEI